MLRVALPLVLCLVLAFGVQISGASAKECVAEIVFHPDPPVAGAETVVVYEIQPVGNPRCAIGSGPDGEPVTILSARGRGGAVSGEIGKADPWHYRAALRFPERGRWELFFDFYYPDSKSGLLTAQNRFTVEVLAATLPAAGSGSRPAEGGAPGMSVLVLLHSESLRCLVVRSPRAHESGARSPCPRRSPCQCRR